MSAANNWASPDPTKNIAIDSANPAEASDANVFLSLLAVAANIIVDSAQVRLVSTSPWPGWGTAPDPIPLTTQVSVSMNKTLGVLNPNVGFEKISSPMPLNGEGVQVEVAFDCRTVSPDLFSGFVNLARFMAAWNDLNQRQALMLSTFGPDLDYALFQQNCAVWVALNTPAPPQPTPPI